MGSKAMGSDSIEEAFSDHSEVGFMPGSVNVSLMVEDSLERARNIITSM